MVKDFAPKTMKTGARGTIYEAWKSLKHIKQNSCWLKNKGRKKLKWRKRLTHFKRL